ncbi:MAG: NRDE family protein [Saprospiraceae bacterium]|nr:NRDE family protein [Saprospiraceae bacterium]
MCTLTIYPKPKKQGFVITFNRDETLQRSSISIQKNEEKGLVYPTDALHGGTWLAFCPQKQRFACLLNGAFEIHKRQLPYRKSRGLVVLESFDFQKALLFCTKYDFEGIEPFTMILGEKTTLIELRWDGVNRYIKILDDTKPHIWSSCTLYNRDIRQVRETWFSDFLKTYSGSNIQAQNLWQLHNTRNSAMPDNAFVMRRPSGVQTVSISQLNYDFFEQSVKFTYHELEQRRTDKYQFDTKQVASSVTI